MVRKALVKGTIKISFVVVALATLGFLVFNYALPVLGDHTSTANLVPEWSPAGQNVDYTVTMSNDGPDTVDEVRIYKNTEYTGFECDEKEGWEMYFITVLQACFYVRNPDTIPAGEFDDFTFSATVPSVGCSLQWKFETRDDDSVWKTISDSTSVDDKEPIVTKTLGEPKIENEETWITQNTPITIDAYDVGDLECAASGLDYCEYRYDVDGDEVLPWTRIELEDLPYTFYFEEDSVHFLEYRCFDEAGNMAYGNETDKVDSTPPETTKSYEGPQEINNGVEWIDGVTQVVLEATDPEPDHASDVDKTWYLNVIDLSENACWSPAEYCNPTTVPSPYVDGVGCINSAQEYCDGNWEIYPSWEACVEDYAYGECQVDPLWKLYKDPFQKAEESCHVLQFFSIDNIGNIESMNTNCFFVDKTPPVLTKDVGEPKDDKSGMKFTTAGTGTAGWSNEQAYSGSYSAKMTTPNPGNEQGRATLPFSGNLNDITSFSYWDYTVNAGTYGQLAIWASIYLDDDDDGLWDYYIQAEPYYTYGPPILDTWQQYDAYNMKWESAEGPDCPSSAPTLGQYRDGSAMLMYCPNGNGPFASREYGTLKIIKIDMRAGYGGPWPGFVGYTDDVVINGNTVLSEPDWSVSPQTPITFTCTDQQPHPSDDEKVCFKVSFDKEPSDLTSLYATKYQTTVGLDGFACVPVNENNQFVFNFNEEEDSLHDLEYYCKDAVEKKSETEIQWYKVDSEPPVITKTVEGPQVGACPPEPEDPLNPCYIQDSVTAVIVNAEDNAGEHDSGMNRCEWSYTVDTLEGGSGVEYSFPFRIIFPEDSTHVLTIECFDNLGNSNTPDIETFLVDSTPPETTKEYGKPFVEDVFPKGCDGWDDGIQCGGEGCNGYGCGWAEWINSSTTISLSANDNKVGVETIYWRNLLIEGTDAAYDICGHLSGYEIQDYCNPQFYYEFVDPETPWNVYTEPFNKPEESCHVIEYYSVDKLGNEEDLRWQCVFVDNSYPEVTKEIGEPKIIKNEDTYITQETPITLTCQDILPHPVDGVALWYRYRLSDDCESWREWTDWIDPDGYAVEKIINFPEDSCHELEYYCVDRLGNTGPIQSEIDIVDTEPPIITKEIVGPQYGDCSPNSEGDCYIDTATEIRVDAVDPEPHPVNDVTCDWNYEVKETETSDGEEEVTPPFVIKFPEESTHDLTITCRDALGNEAEDVETFLVDKTPPETTKSYEGPQEINNGVEWITSETLVNLSAEDEKSGVKATYWRNTLVDDTYCDGIDEERDDILDCDDAEGSEEFNLYEGPFQKEEESCHLIEYYSVDNVDKTEEVNRQCVFVDNTPPIIEKIIDGPQYGQCPPENEGDKCYIDGETQIQVEATDPDPHPVNAVSCYWWYWLDEVRYPSSGVYRSFPIYFPEESNHTLYVNCKDALGNKAEDIETFLVDKTPPETTKTYEGFYNITNGIEWINTDTLIHLDASDNKAGVNETWYRNTLVDDEYCLEREECGDAEGKGEFQLYTDPFNKPEESCHLIEYYSVDNVNKTEEVNRQCVFVDDSLPVPNKTVGEPKAECSEGDWCDWKITTLTPVKLDCSDTHIVGEQEVCYRIFLDGELQGDWNCVGTPQTIYFEEESNHTLEYYCKDLVQTGTIDSENFKVEGTAFTIHLNKKWNLISVPFVMLNNSMDEAFKDVGTDISSVWTYDAETDQWYVYTPDNGPDTLTEMKPGWGYWVLAKNDTLLVIGGSLFSPATTPPSRDLLEGWNLIGYYGTEDMLTYDGPDGNGDSADCALNSLGSSIWDKEFTSLWTYWESYNPNQWIPYNKWNNMDPGAGYWVSIPESGLYTPSTTCWD